MILTDAVPKPIFARHESFHLRYGWLKKAYNQVKQDPDIFHKSNVTVRLGVGKNMVHAIKFWGIANKILEMEGETSNGNVITTEMGDLIFDDDKGLDPYLENPNTLWLLHWLLFAAPCQVPVWWLIMNEISATNIKINEMTDTITQRVTNIPEWKTPNEKSIKKDIDVFMHTYSAKKDKLTTEDYLDCPFRQLYLVQHNSRDMMRFVTGKKHGMSPLMTAFACLDFMERVKTTAKSVSVNRLATESGGVGNIFRLNENELADLLKSACDETKAIKMQDINGSPHLTFNKNSMEKVLGQAYGKKINFKQSKTREMLAQ